MEQPTPYKNYPVGELGHRWALGSDHLPIGGTVNSIHFGLWNILATSALHHIERNTQGLKDSFIMRANVLHQENLTVRECIIISQILNILQHPTYPKSLLCVQEITEEVFIAIQKKLPDHLKLIPNDVSRLKDGDVFIYDSSIFDFIDFKCNYYQTTQSKHSKTYMTLSLIEKHTQQLYKFIQSHVPGGPNAISQPARVEFVEAMINDYNPEAITIVMGDMNRPVDCFIELLETVAPATGLDTQPFEPLISPYPTHINTHLEASWIDNVLISIPDPLKTTVEVKVAEDASFFFDALQYTLDLLKSLETSEEIDSSF
ncbi:MAG: hypothetical protein ACXU9U_03625 [Parachlamydiaceae bacterium]